MPSPSRIILTILVVGVALAQIFRPADRPYVLPVVMPPPVVMVGEEAGPFFMTMQKTATRVVAWFDARSRGEEAGGCLVCMTTASETAVRVDPTGTRHSRALVLPSRHDLVRVMDEHIQLICWPDELAVNLVGRAARVLRPIHMNRFHGVLVCWNANHPGPAVVNRDGEMFNLFISLEACH